MGMGRPPPQPTRDSIVSSPSGVRGRAPAENSFGAYYIMQDANGCRKIINNYWDITQEKFTYFSDGVCSHLMHLVGYTSDL